MLRLCLLFIVTFVGLKVNAYDLITSKKITQEKTFTNKIISLNQGKHKSKKSFLSPSRSCSDNKVYDSIINASGKLYEVDPQFIKAIIASESCFNPKAVSNKGAQGLMQLMPFTAKRFGVADSFSAEQNILGGVKYLSFLQNLFKNNLELVAASYNAGEGAVKHYQGIPPYRETINYVKKVMGLYAIKTKLVTKGGTIQETVSVPLKRSQKCESKIKEIPYSYLVVNATSVNRYYNGPNTDSYAQISLKTKVPLSAIKRFNKNLVISKKEEKTKSKKVLLWQCQFK